MRFGRSWFHDHHWDTIDREKAHWRVVLLVTLVGIVVLFAIMLIFPDLTF